MFFKKLLILNTIVAISFAIFSYVQKKIEKPLQANTPLSQVSIDLEDFGSPTLTTATVLLNAEACGFNITASTGRVSSDPTGGFRISGSTGRYLSVELGSYQVVGFTGTFYISTASRTMYFNGENNITFTRIASSGTEIKTITDMVQFSKYITNNIFINANDSMGIIEITLYYI
jgi:hypothetical protein